MNIEKLNPGFVGISDGLFSLNAVCIDMDGDPCFFEVDLEQAGRLNAWAQGFDTRPIEDILSDLEPEYIDLLVRGDYLGFPDDEPLADTDQLSLPIFLKR